MSKDNPPAALSFQDLILELERYWAGRGCVILQPYDMQMGMIFSWPDERIRSFWMHKSSWHLRVWGCSRKRRTSALYDHKKKPGGSFTSRKICSKHAVFFP